MLRLLGLNAYVRALVGIGLGGVGIGTHRPLLIGVGAAIALWSVTNILIDLKSRDRR
ncbi:hypothetical protein [Kribbella sp. NPDC049584]|uniref:hypothetical protein n=1 Tax=Kribbella sp. NPDC049584 TaxID=3154833 RepID=UPI0034157AB8